MGSAAVALGCIRPPRRRHAALVAAPLTATGLALRSHASLVLPVLAVGLVVLVLVLPGSPSPRFGDRFRLVLLWVSAVGLWLAVPDTEAVVLALGAVTALAPTGLLGDEDSLSPVTFLPLVAVLLWATFDGATSAAMASAAVGAFGLLIVEPALPASPRPRPGGELLALALGHSAVVASCARVAAPRGDLTGVGISLLALVALALLARVISRDAPQHRGRRSTS